MFDVVDHIGVAGDEASDRRKGLRECPHDKIDLIFDTKMLAGPSAGVSEYPESVGIVNHQASAILILEFCQPQGGLRCRPPSRKHRRRK